jgi:hypothetical protein
MRRRRFAQPQGRANGLDRGGAADKSTLLLNPLVEEPSGDLGSHVGHLEKGSLNDLKLPQGVPHDTKKGVCVLRGIP